MKYSNVFSYSLSNSSNIKKFKFFIYFYRNLLFLIVSEKHPGVAIIIWGILSISIDCYTQS